MYNKKKVLIIVYNSFHQIIASSIITSSNYSNTSFILDHSNYNEKLNKICIYKFVGGNILVKFFKILYWRFYLNIFIKKHNIEEIIIPHTDGILSNYAFNYTPLNIKKSLFHEGNLSLYEFDKRLYSISFKLILSYLMFFRFIKHDNIMPVNESTIYKFYTPIISDTILSDKRKAFKILLPGFKFKNIDKNVALFLSTDNIDTNKFNETIFLVINLFQSNNIKKVFYKPHQSDNKNIFLDLLSKHFIIEILDKQFGIESITSSISPSLVLSFSSSAFINLTIENKNIKFYSIFFENSYNINIYNYFTKIGVKNFIV